MWFVIIFVLLLFLLARLSTFLDTTRKEVVNTIGDVVVASRIPSGVMTVLEMQERDIHPFFCFTEYRMVWVEHPSEDETCPWCNNSLIPAS